MPLARWSSGYGVVNDILYIAGGYFNPPGSHTIDVQAYNAGTNTWSLKNPRPNVQTNPASGVINGILYTAGGTNTSTYINTLMAYNPVADNLTTRASMPTTRSSASAGVINGVMYVVGGGNSSGGLNTVEAYDPASDSWTTKTPMPTTRGDLGVGVVNGILYAVGGATSSGAVLNTVEAYDPMSDRWTAKAPMPTAQRDQGVAVLDGILYAVGGADGTRVLDTVQAYDAASDTWTTEPSLPTARAALEVAAENGHLYAVGGYNDMSAALTTNEVFTPITLTATGTTLSAIAGQRFAAVVSSFTDAGPNPGAATDYSAVIDWGDSSRLSTGGISDNGDGTYDIAASHTYTDPGTYTATINITDNRSTSRTASAITTIEVDPGSAPGPGNHRFFHDLVVASKVNIPNSPTSTSSEPGAAFLPRTSSDSAAVSISPMPNADSPAPSDFAPVHPSLTPDWLAPLALTNTALDQLFANLLY
jgi:N-acetylneuraminic acid mutarotase